MFIPWPDTDYPPGHPDRCWGTLTVKGAIDACNVVDKALCDNAITKDESDYIKSQIGKDFIPHGVMEFLRR